MWEWKAYIGEIMMVGKRQALQDKSPLLSVSGVHHRYGSSGAVALRDLSLEVRSGEILCLLGASGSGKSTVLRVLAGLERVSAGEIIFNGQVVCGRSARGFEWVPPEKRRMGLVFQDFVLFPHLTVAENIAYGVSVPDASSRVCELLEAFALEGYGDKYPHHLSGGEQQRVALARSLAPEPHLLLMDEPFSGLDARLKDTIRDWVLHILKSRNIGAVIVTHDFEEALYMADRIAVIDGGHIIQSGYPDSLYLHPVNSFVAEFFGQVNKVHRRVSGGGIETPFGWFGCADIADGECVNLLFRPEHLALVEASCDSAEALPSECALARVEAVRMLGRSSLIHLQVWCDGDYSLHMHARVSGVSLASEGNLVELSLNRQAALIFHESC